jgi:fluoride exporter
VTTAVVAVAFLAAAALGTLARAEAGRRWNRHAGLPLGTVVVNVSGSFLLGWLSQVGPPVLTVLGIGALGAYTTFSSFARDVVALVEQRRAGLAAGYVAVTLGLGVAAAAAGVALA